MEFRVEKKRGGNGKERVTFGRGNGAWMLRQLGDRLRVWVWGGLEGVRGGDCVVVDEERIRWVG